jgi:hypothetical protein
MIYLSNILLEPVVDDVDDDDDDDNNVGLLMTPFMGEVPALLIISQLLMVL